jgi:hypothetical protein
MLIEMTLDEVRLATLLAQERWLAKFGSTDRPNYAKGKASGNLEHELLATIRANICEWAVAKALDLSWNVPMYPNSLHTRRSKIADVGINGEVRSVRTASGFPFWEKDKGRVIYGVRVHDLEYYSRIEVVGAFCADQYMLAQYRDNSINGWRVPISVVAELGLTSEAAKRSECLCKLGEHRCDV